MRMMALAEPNLTLQWGRAQMSAEMAQKNYRTLYQSRTSMGPRSDERGNAQAAACAAGRQVDFNGAALR